MGQSSSSAPDTSTPLLIVHRVNDPARVKALFSPDGGSPDGFELDVHSNGAQWFVGHDRSDEGVTWDAYWRRVRTDMTESQLIQRVKIVYIDIKTPSAENLIELADIQNVLPTITFLFATANGRDARHMMRLPAHCILVADFENQKEAHEVWSQYGRRFWLADGIAAGVVKQSRILSDRDWPYMVEGRLSWTYSDLNTWRRDVEALQLTATIVTESLLRKIKTA